MIPLLIWVGASALVGYLGRRRRIGFVGFFILSLIFTPVVCLLILLVSGRSGDPLTS